MARLAIDDGTGPTRDVRMFFTIGSAGGGEPSVTVLNVCVLVTYSFKVLKQKSVVSSSHSYVLQHSFVL
eukprot:705892-Amphidinium_carterae.1